MLLDPDTENDVAYELCQLLGRAILPISRRDGRAGDEAFGTAFFFTGPAVAGEPAPEYLLTADVLTHAPGGEIGLRPSITEPAGVGPGQIPLGDLAEQWIHLPEVGLAAMPTGGLHEHAAGEGWRWRTQQVTDGVAADAAVVARIGSAPSSAFVLALGVADDGSRPLEAVIERLVRDGDKVRITTELPRGYVGAPVFGVEATEDGSVGLSCLGLVLPGDGGHPVATFDRIRAAIAAATAGQS